MYEISERIGYFGQKVNVVTGIGSTLTRLVGADPTRGYLALTVGNNATLALYPGLFLNISNPVFVTTQNGTQEIWFERHGPMSTWEWWGKSSGGISSLIVTVTEILWMPPQEE